jgi:hypothetical protein
MHASEIRSADHESRIGCPILTFNPSVKCNTVFTSDSFASNGDRATVFKFQNNLVAFKSAAFVSNMPDTSILKALHTCLESLKTTADRTPRVPHIASTDRIANITTVVNTSTRT